MAARRILIFNLKTDADDAVLGFTTDWINELSHHYERVFVVSTSCGRLAVRDNVTVHSVGGEAGYSKLRRAVTLYRIVYRVLKTENVDACFAHMNHLFVVASYPLLALNRIPIVLWYAHKAVPFSLRLAALVADRIVTSSLSGFQIRTSKLTVIGQGIDTDKFTPRENCLDTREFVILAISRLSPIKRLSEVIDAFSLVLASGMPHARLKIVGGPLTQADAAYACSLVEDVKRRGLSDYIEFCGPIPFNEIHSTYTGAHCFINLSETDSVDKTVLEAMSCGLPVITSNAAFKEILPEVLLETCMVEKRNPCAAAEAIKHVAAMNPEERRLYALQLRELVVGKHSLNGLATRLREVIEGYT